MSTALPQVNRSAKQGLLLVGHGTRNAQGLAEFWGVARHVAELAKEFTVEPCFLELAEPNIATAVKHLLQQTLERLTVAPLLLFAAGHAKRDIPIAVNEAIANVRQTANDPQGCKTAMGDRTAATNQLLIDQLPALECQPRILELSAQRYAEALIHRPQIPATQTLLLLVGRGSSQAGAISAMQQFAAFRQQQTAVDHVEVCFAAIAKPMLREALAAAACSNYRRIVVQPHLLFTGQVLQQIADEVKKHEGSGINGQHPATGPQKEWVVTSHLGVSSLIAEAVVEMARSSNRMICSG